MHLGEPLYSQDKPAHQLPIAPSAAFERDLSTSKHIGHFEAVHGPVHAQAVDCHSRVSAY
jgi:hypothetical protein